MAGKAKVVARTIARRQSHTHTHTLVFHQGCGQRLPSAHTHTHTLSLSELHTVGPHSHILVHHALPCQPPQDSKTAFRSLASQSWASLSSELLRHPEPLLTPPHLANLLRKLPRASASIPLRLASNGCNKGLLPRTQQLQIQRLVARLCCGKSMMKGLTATKALKLKHLCRSGRPQRTDRKALAQAQVLQDHLVTPCKVYPNKGLGCRTSKGQLWELLCLLAARA